MTFSTVTPNVSSATVNESLAPSSMERTSAFHDLPHVPVQKFDGSPQQYPAFCQRFKQVVETKPLDDVVKMTQLLQFLEEPALLSVSRYEYDDYDFAMPSNYLKVTLKIAGERKNLMINRQQTAQRALTGDGVVKNTQSYLRCKICASVRHLPKMDKSVVQYLPHFLLLEHLASQTESTAKAAQTTRRVTCLRVITLATSCKIHDANFLK